MDHPPPQPVEVRAAFGQELKRYEDSMYGTQWTCTCDDFGKYPGNQCWHIAASIYDRRFWPPHVVDKVASYAERLEKVITFPRK